VPLEYLVTASLMAAVIAIPRVEDIWLAALFHGDLPHNPSK